MLRTTTLAETKTVIQRSTSQPVAQSSSGSIHAVSPDTAIAGESVQTLPPPYLGEMDTLISGDGSRAGAIVSNVYLTCLVIVGLVYSQTCV